MVALKRSEISLIEDFVSYPNGRGYVLDFSDRTMGEFFEDELRVDIYGGEFNDRGSSKRNHLISFCLKSDGFYVGRVLRLLAERRSAIISQQGVESPDRLEAQFMELTARVEAGSDRPKADALYRYVDDRTLDELVSDVERTIAENKPEAALDHLHTYCTKKFAHLLRQRGIECGKDEALHARFGKYRKALLDEHDLHETSNLVMKSAISIFERFNDVRNNHSFAHDNEILAHAEARFIFDSVCALLRFVKSLEAGRFESSNGESEKRMPEDF